MNPPKIVFFDRRCNASSSKMIRRTIFFLLVFLVPHIATAQEKPKYWIFLTDKQDALAKRTQAEETYVTDKAIARRALRGEPGLTTRFAVQDAPISQEYEADLIRRGVKIEQRSRWLNAVTARLSKEELKQVTALPYVRSTRPVALLSSDIQPSAPISPVIPERVSANCPSNIFGNSCTQLDVVNAIPAIQRGINGRGVTLGFIDSKFNTTGTTPFSHPALVHIRNDNRLQEFRDFTQRDPAQACPETSTTHGLYVTSVAIGYKKGQLIGPGHGATIYAASAECSPYERNIEEDNFVVAVEWLESEGVEVVTASLSYFEFDDGQRSYEASDLDGDTGITTIVMDWATQRGVVSVAGAGNSGPGPRTIGTPADGDSVITVGGVRSDKVVVGFSSRGPTADGRIKPDVSGQASSVWVSQGGAYRLLGGTSLSTPMIAGIVTQILQVNPALGPRDVWRILTSTASQANSPDNNLGWGIVDADAAISKALAEFLHPALSALYTATNRDQWNNNSGWDIREPPPSMNHFKQWHGLIVVDQNLGSISLENNNLRGVLPSELGELSELTTLRLENNHLSGELSPEICNLSKLDDLRLSENNFTGTLPRCFLKLKNLTTLDFTNSGACAPPDDEFQAWLRTISNVDGPTCSRVSFSGSIANQSYPHTHPISPLVLPEAVGGDAPITYSLAPALPTGLSFDSSTRTLSGTPTEVTPSTSFTYTAIDANANQAALNFSMEVYSTVEFTERIDDQFYPRTYPILPLIFPEALGGLSPITYSLTLGLPEGLGFESSTRTLNGTPTEAMAQTSFTYAATDANGDQDTLNFSMEVYSVVEFTASIEDQSYPRTHPIIPLIFPEAFGGYTPIIYSLAPALPEGLRFDSSTRTLSGIPTEVIPPTSFTYTATDANGDQGTLNFSMEIYVEVKFVARVEDQTYPRTYPIPPLILPEASGRHAPITYSLAPELPTGLRFDSSTRTLSGTPTEVTPPTSFTYTATDANGGQDTLSFSMEIYSAIEFSMGIEDQSYPRTHPIPPLILPEASGGRSPITYSLAPAPPEGVRFDPSTRTLSGIPTEVTPSTPFTYKATDANHFQDSLAFTIEVYSPVSNEQELLPVEFVVHASYPNPFRGATSIQLDLPWPARVEIEVLDMTGRRVLVRPPTDLPAGSGQEIVLRGMETLPSGTYLYRLTANSAKESSTYVGHFVHIR